MMGAHTFRSRERLKKNADFRRARQKGATFKKEEFSLTLIRNNIANHRLGLSIGARIMAQSSRRNRLKRLLREIYRINKHQIKNGPYDIIISLRGRIDPGHFNYNEIRNKVLALMKKANISKPGAQ